MGLTDGKKPRTGNFPGNPEGTEMERLAWAVSHELQPAADYYIDLHSGDDYEQLTSYVYYAGMADEKTVSQSRRMAEQVDVPYMVRSNVASGGAYNYAASQGIPSILIEQGRHRGPGPVKKYALQEETSGTFSVIWESIMGEKGLQNLLSSGRYRYLLSGRFPGRVVVSL